jgi:hypothetical protein
MYLHTATSNPQHAAMQGSGKKTRSPQPSSKTKPTQKKRHTKRPQQHKTKVKQNVYQNV